MNTNLQSAKHDANVYKLMDKFLGKRMRHLLVEKEGKYIGILSSGDVMRATMQEKDEELKKLNAMGLIKISICYIIFPSLFGKRHYRR
jgi:signal-transduction protein with cAMP-binding, CBS, and nucleotidyltransferase domain